MPHVIIEYSANVEDHHDITDLIDAVHSAVLGLELASPAAVRVRAVRRDHYKVADGSDPNHGFVAIVARIGPGRSAEVKHQVIETVLDHAEEVITPDTPLLIAWSMELQEIDAEFRTNRNHIKARCDVASGQGAQH